MAADAEAVGADTEVGLQKVGKVGSSMVLGQNLEASGVARPAQSAAHHMVADDDLRAAPARAILQRFGIDINRAINGVFLPQNSKSVNQFGAAVHSTLHTNAYYAWVNELMIGAQSRLEAEQVLDFIRAQLLSGYAPR